MSEYDPNPKLASTAREFSSLLLTAIMRLSGEGATDKAILVAITAECAATFVRANESPATSPPEPAVDTRNVGIA